MGRRSESALAGETPRHGFLAKVEPEGAWVSREYRPKTYTVPLGVREFSQLVRVEELFEIIPGIHFPRRVAEGRGGHPVIRRRDRKEP